MGNVHIKCEIEIALQIEVLLRKYHLQPDRQRENVNPIYPTELVKWYNKAMRIFYGI